MSYPNGVEWSALKTETILNEDTNIKLSTISCGKLKLPSGKLIICDPFSGMSKSDNHFVQVPPGEYEVIVTLADVSPNLDGSHFREAYASLIIDSASLESSRRFLEPTENGKPSNLQSSNQPLASDEFIGYGVDAGTSCFADAETIHSNMPNEDTWYDALFENENNDCWFNQMDDKNLIRKGIANITLPITDNNLILFHSGWGDGYYPVIGGYDLKGNLIAVHTDFYVVLPSDLDSEDSIECAPSKPWWNFLG